MKATTIWGLKKRRGTCDLKTFSPTGSFFTFFLSCCVKNTSIPTVLLLSGIFQISASGFLLLHLYSSNFIYDFETTIFSLFVKS